MELPDHTSRKQTHSSPPSHWRGTPFPEPGWVVGYAFLIDHFELRVPLPRTLALVTERYDPDAAPGFLVFGRRRLPDPTFASHIEFAIKEEGIRLDVLYALFNRIRELDQGQDILEAYLRSTPLGKYARRIWFLYEWMLNERLNLPDVTGRPGAVDAVDTSLQVGTPDGELSRRHQVRNNMPGTRRFCPMIWRTTSIKKHESASYDRMALHTIGNTHPDLMARAAAFLLLSDSRSSFEIEGERPSPDRTRRWGQAILEAGQRDLNTDELIRLQHIIIGDTRFVQTGLRTEGGFVGMRDRMTRDPIPEHISAKPEDLEALLDALVEYLERAMPSGIDPVHIAAALSFGFVYIHPFQDGNGRIHRWLIHFVLARAGYNPPGIPFPISAVILRHIERYRTALRSFSARLLPCIDWTTTDRHNVHVLNDTAAYYRFFDATLHAEFLFKCVQETVEHDLPAEVRFLESFDAFEQSVRQMIDMPRDTVDLLFRFLHQSDGRLSKRARSREFSALTDEEVARVEAIFSHYEFTAPAIGRQ